MRKIHLLGLTLLALFAVGAAETSAALGATVWLEKSEPVLEKLLVLSEGELLLEDTKATGGAVDVLCSGLNEGWIGGDATGNLATWDEITSITGLNVTTEPLWVLCVFTARGACEASSPPEAMALNLPWLTELLLVGTINLDDLFGAGTTKPGWVVLCLALGLSIEDECIAEASPPSVDLTNSTENDVIAEFLEAETAHCSIGGTAAGLVAGTTLIFAESGESLSISEGEE